MTKTEVINALTDKSLSKILEQISGESFKDSLWSDLRGEIVKQVDLGVTRLNVETTVTFTVLHDAEL